MSRPEVALRVEIVPVILLSADGDDTPPRPEGHDQEEWAAWRDQNRIVLGLAPEDLPDGIHIAVRAVDNDRLLGAAVDYALECAEGHGTLFPYMDGGVVILFDGKVVASPDCCVDLSDGLDGWTDFIARRPNEWELVWTGHQSPLVRVRGEVVEISAQADDPVGQVAARAEVNVFQNATDQMQRERAAFAKRLELCLEERGYEDPALGSKIIAGLVDPPD